LNYDDLNTNAGISYYITGKTFCVRERLREWGCMWNNQKECWILTNSAKGAPDYMAVENMGLNLTPISTDIASVPLEALKIINALEKE